MVTGFIKEQNENKQKILIVDDSEMNRAILSEILSDQFEIIEARNGYEALAVLRKLDNSVSLVLLDVVMPEMDGFEVLAYMNKYNWISDIPVIMISSENSPSVVEHAYNLGVTDFISRPFDANVVSRRAKNTILLYVKQKQLVGLVVDQMYEKQKSNNLMIEILSHIVEFRNGESGMHVLHISIITKILLNCLIKKTDKYNITQNDIQLIATASALHDIGKIGIPDEILNKPGRFTPEEFEIMKTHSALGAGMLEEMPFYQNEPLVKIAYEICRWHHERYDGRGYPDGLKGDEIPVSAQVVAVADVYDALTSERCYKKAYTHEKAMEMILGGECGSFSSLMLECLKDSAEEIQRELKISSAGPKNKDEITSVAEEMMKHEVLDTSSRTLSLLEHERTKLQFYSEMTDDIMFEYTSCPPLLTFDAKSARMMGFDEFVTDPKTNEKIRSMISDDDVQAIDDIFKSLDFENPIGSYQCGCIIRGEKKQVNIKFRLMPSALGNEESYIVIGTITDLGNKK